MNNDDEITLLRLGRMIGMVPAEEAVSERLVKMMVAVMPSWTVIPWR